MVVGSGMQIEKSSLGDRVLAELRRKIIAGDLAAGSALRQEKLAADLGVSRIPVREAIRKLEAEGLVHSEPHRGSVVAPLSLEELTELFELRMRLEPWLFGLAIPLMTEAQFAAAEAVIATSVASVSIDSWSDLNWQFHAALYEAAQRPQAMRMLTTLHQIANRYINLHRAVVHDVQVELSDHRALVQHARVRDVHAGMAALAEHIRRVAAGLQGEIKHQASKAMPV
jgi:DNA-binding GntR family transcriptional regulator